MFDELWRPQTVAVWQEWSNGDFRCYKKTFDGPWHLAQHGKVIFTAPDLQTVMARASSVQEATHPEAKEARE